MLTANRVLVPATLGVGLAVLVPHLVASTATTGAPWGIVLLSYEIAIPAVEAANAPSSLAVTVRQLMTRFTYWPLAALAVAGLIGWIRVWVVGRGSRTWRAYTFVLVPALGQIAVTGTSFHTELRFYVFPMALLVIAGSMAAASAWRSLARHWRQPVGLFVAVGALFIVVRAGLANVDTQTRSEGSDAVRRAAAAIRDDASDSCSVMAYLVPEVTWYTGCATYRFGATLPGDDRYLLLLAGERTQQPTGDELATYLEGAEPDPVATVRDGDGNVIATVYRFP